MLVSDKNNVKGRYRIRTYDSITKKLKRVSPWIENLIVSSDQHGINLIMRRLIGDNTFSIEINQAKIGTGNTAPAGTDTDLETPVTDGIVRANQSVANNVATLEFFISDLELPNGTYKEFGLFCTDQLFARSLISPNYTKSSNEDTSVEYELTITAS
jgi:hypothetical protein